MRKGIETLAWLLSRDPDRDTLTLGSAGEKYGETPERIADALDVLKIIRGEPTVLPRIDWDD